MVKGALVLNFIKCNGCVYHSFSNSLTFFVSFHFIVQVHKKFVCVPDGRPSAAAPERTLLFYSMFLGNFDVYHYHYHYYHHHHYYYCYVFLGSARLCSEGPGVSERAQRAAVILVCAGAKSANNRGPLALSRLFVDSPTTL